MKNVLRFTAFLLVLAIIMTAGAYYLYPASNRDLWKNDGGGILGEPEESLDYIIIGDSNAVSGFSPLSIWHDYGYAGYVLGENAQTMCDSYYMMKKIVKNQNPKVVIIEADCLYPRGDSTVERYKMLAKGVINAAFPIFKYHTNWLKIPVKNAFNFKKDNSWKCWSKGQRINCEVKAFQGNSDYLETNGGVYSVDFITETYLKMFTQKMKKNGTSVIIVSVPCATDWSNNKHNAVSACAEKVGVPFIDMNTDKNGQIIDWSTDTRDKGMHLNCHGAEKTSSFLGKYLKDNHSLTSHLSDSSYSDWTADYQKYLEKTK